MAGPGGTSPIDGAGIITISRQSNFGYSDASPRDIDARVKVRCPRRLSRTVHDAVTEGVRRAPHGVPAGPIERATYASCCS